MCICGWGSKQPLSMAITPIPIVRHYSWEMSIGDYLAFSMLYTSCFSLLQRKISSVGYSAWPSQPWADGRILVDDGWGQAWLATLARWSLWGEDHFIQELGLRMMLLDFITLCQHIRPSSWSESQTDYVLKNFRGAVYLLYLESHPDHHDA